MGKMLALNDQGMMTYCTVDPELRGTGKCNHIAHQNTNESQAKFIERINNTPTLRQGYVKPLVDDEGTTIEVKQYHMTEEEKSKLVKIEARSQLDDRDMEGGYIECDEMLWSDMDKATFAEKFGYTKSQINNVLNGNSMIVFSSDNESYPVGKIITPRMAEKLDDLDEEVLAESGVSALNSVSEQFGFESTKDIYVLPYYMRQGVEEYDSDVTAAYKYLQRNRKDPDKMQMAYERLLNSASAANPAYYRGGFAQKSLADRFAGKSGIFTSQMSGANIPYSGRAVITPSTDLKFGEVGLPPSQAVDLFSPTIKEQLKQEGKTDKEIKDYFYRAYNAGSKNDTEIAKDLDERLRKADVRVIINRQPSLHYSSLQGMRPRVAEWTNREEKDGGGERGGKGAAVMSAKDAVREGDRLGGRKANVSGDFSGRAVVGGRSRAGRGAEVVPSVRVRPEYCKALSGDFDGDSVSLYGINDIEISNHVDSALDAKLPINTQVPRAVDKSNILPQKDALFGLLNILKKRSN